jgi:two-component system, OmpR family, heavy metal sensor histidine kinase CusS
LTDLATAFDAMLQRLEDSFTRLSQFSADIAHELRTPVNNIRGQTEVAVSRTRTNEEYCEVLHSNLEEMERLTRMIDSLLFLARAEHGTAVQRAELDAAVESRSVAEFYEAYAEEKSIVVTVEGSGRIFGDSSLVRRAISNLLMNALRHTAAGGRVEIQIREVANGVEIRVSDTGSGIAAEHLPRLFDRFYRSDPARSGSAENVGLGLAIVKSITQLHGGTATVRSELGRGSAFTLFFPRPI